MDTRGVTRAQAIVLVLVSQFFLPHSNLPDPKKFATEPQFILATVMYDDVGYISITNKTEYSTYISQKATKVKFLRFF